jgi:hypothetical protein
MLVLLAAAAVTTAAPAQEAKLAVRPPMQTFVLDPGEIRVTELIDKSAAFLGRNILFTEQELAGPSSSLKLQQRVEVDVRGCEELLNTLLYTRGLVVLPLDEEKKIYEVINLAGPRQREVTNRATLRSPEELLARPTLRVPVSTVIKLRHINATVATNALRPFFAATGGPNAGSLTLGNVGNNTAILITGLQDQVAAAIRMIQIADVPAPPEAVPPGLAEQVDALQRRVESLEKRLGDAKAK